MSTIEHDNALSSPFGHVFLRPETDQVINCAMGLQHPIDVAALKAELSTRLVTQHPRFSSLLVRDPRRPSQLQWRTTVVNIDDHVVVIPCHIAANSTGENEAGVNAYLADLTVSPPMSMDKPLWEVHVLTGLNCVVLRVHHAVGDGISLMSLLAACFGGEKAAVGGGGGGGGCEEKKKKRGTRWRKGGLWGVVRSLWYTVVYLAEFMAKILGLRDKKTVVKGGEGVELWPRTAATAGFEVDDMKEVKKAIPNVTMNDVLLGVIASGLAKYLDVHSPKALLKGIEMTSIVIANLRKESGLQDMSNLMESGSGSSWGNKFGFFLVPINCRQESVHPLQHVTRMKAIMDRKKQSFEAHFTLFFMGLVVSLLGPKIGSWFCKRMAVATTLLISNIVGPPKQIAIAGNPVTSIRLTISSLAQAMILHLLSYQGRANLLISVAKDIIPDAEFLAKCFEDALLDMKNAALAKANVDKRVNMLNL